jgi:hypothetical protein
LGERASTFDEEATTSNGWSAEDSEVDALSAEIASGYEEDNFKLGDFLPSRRLLLSSGRFPEVSINAESFNALVFQLTTLITALMAKFWGTNITEHYVNVICQLGPLIYFEGYLSVDFCHVLSTQLTTFSSHSSTATNTTTGRT